VNLFWLFLSVFIEWNLRSYDGKFCGQFLGDLDWDLLGMFRLSVGGLGFGLGLRLELRPGWMFNGGGRGSVSRACSVMLIVGCSVVGSARPDLKWLRLE
jgi:hypothetical protein